MVLINNSNQQRLEEKFQGLEEKFQGLEARFDGLESRFDSLESRFQGFEESQLAMRKENEFRFNDIDKKLNTLLSEQEFIWEKVVRNEREIGVMKIQLKL